MGDATRELAVRVEGLLPRVLRALFKPDPLDPLAELPVGQMRMMRLLMMKTWTPSNLGEELGLSVSAVTQMANRLDSIGYVARVEDPVDRRVKHLTLTLLGRDLMSRRQKQRVHRLERVLSHISESRQTELVDMLESLLDAGAKAAEYAENSIFMEAEVEQKLPLPPKFVMEEK